LAVAAVTYRCNSRCRMCNIWKMDTDKSAELKPAEYAKLPVGLEEINLTGGEPFLRDDLVEILDVIASRCRRAKIVMPTNGFLTEKIVSSAKKIIKRDYLNRLHIAVSLDGLGYAHEEIRGIPEAFAKAATTIDGLKRLGFPAANLGFGYTFMKGNEDELAGVAELAGKLGVNYGVSLAHNSDNYFSTHTNHGLDAGEIKRQAAGLIRKKISSFKKNELGKCYYLHGLVEFAENGKRLVPCDALRGSFFMDPSGNIFPCNIVNQSVGNLKENSFAEIWDGEKAAAARRAAAACQTPCWMVCTAKYPIKKHWLKAGWWILREKIKKIVYENTPDQ